MMRKVLPQGFTLIEVLIVIVLIGVIVLTSVIGFKQQKIKAFDAKRKSDIEEIRVALHDFYIDNSCFPKELPACGNSLDSGKGAHMRLIPCDPDGKDYVYQVPEDECPQTFKVLTNIKIDRDISIDKVGCRNGCGRECNYNYGVSSSNIRIYEDCVTEYACTPSGECAAFEDPELSRCPVTFENDPTCGNYSCNKRTNKCHDERGKRVPN